MLGIRALVPDEPAARRAGLTLRAAPETEPSRGVSGSGRSLTRGEVHVTHHRQLSTLLRPHHGIQNLKAPINKRAEGKLFTARAAPLRLVADQPRLAALATGIVAALGPRARAAVHEPPGICGPPTTTSRLEAIALPAAVKNCAGPAYRQSVSRFCGRR